MLTFVFTDIYDEEITVKNPYSLSINMEEDVPADSLVAVFEYFQTQELKKVCVKNGDEIIFTGIVDEQQLISSSSGEFLKIVARSMAALLLDNESVPISYTHPSVSVIASRHITPFSLKVSDCDDTTYFKEQTVQKGESNYQAVEDFSKNTFLKKPRVNSLGEVDFNGVQKDREVVFSHDIDGIRYKSVLSNIKRCEEISRVRIKVTNSSGYHSVVENKDAISRGIVRERYLNAVLTETPLSLASKMINNSKKKSYTVTLECDGMHLSVFGCKAVVKLRNDKCIEGLYVSGVRYALGHNSNVTTVILKRKEV